MIGGNRELSECFSIKIAEKLFVFILNKWDFSTEIVIFVLIKIKAMGKALTFVRLTDYTNMRISELVSMTGQNKSVVIRSLIDRSINELTDQDGNWKINGKKSKTGKG